MPDINELTYGLPFDGSQTVRGQAGSLWSEWGDMAEYGWPGSPAEGRVWADNWATLSLYGTDKVLMIVLSGKHNRDEQYSSNGTMVSVSLANANMFRRCAILHQE